MATRKPSVKKSPNMKGYPGITGKFEGLPEGTNTELLKLNIELGILPDVDLNNPDAVRDRIVEYLGIYAKYDMKPTVAGLSLALGLDKRRLWEIYSGKIPDNQKHIKELPEASRGIIKKAYGVLENLWEGYFNSGKINPVAGIFLAKNHFGYTDQQEHIITPNVEPVEDYSREDILAKYQALPESSDSDND